MEILTPTPVRSEELELKLFSAIADAHRKEMEKDALRALLDMSNNALRVLLMAEKARVEKRKAAWRYAGAMVLLGLFSFGCTLSAVACLCSGIWWTAIAPIVLLIAGVRTWFKNL